MGSSDERRSDKVAQRDVVLYAHDLREVTAVLDAFEALFTTTDAAFEAGTRLVLWSKNDYHLGTLEYEEGQWRFVLAADAVGDSGSSADNIGDAE